MHCYLLTLTLCYFPLTPVSLPLHPTRPPFTFRDPPSLTMAICVSYEFGAIRLNLVGSAECMQLKMMIPLASESLARRGRASGATSSVGKPAADVVVYIPLL